MSLYEILLFVHILAAAAWVGGGFMLHLIAERAVKSDDPVRINHLLQDAEIIGKRYFGPATGVTFLAGLWLVFEGDWGFDQVFVLGGIAGVVLSSVLGFGMIQPTAVKVGQALSASPTMTDEIRAGLNRIQTVSRIDSLLLIVVVFLMTNKPGT
jgi:uncharacterized membrane protein